MATSAPFLNVPYGAFFHRDVPPEDAELTHVGPGTPCGEWFRRFWQPVAIRILGEDLVLFRDRSGQIGLLELHRSHRGTSLEFGQIEERGIRCCYHAWLYDVDGKILETPGEPAESTLKDRLCHGAYPTHEYNGLVFAYMGPQEKQPPFPVLDTYDLPGYGRLTDVNFLWPCNWLQVLDNSMDPAHVRFLHNIPGNPSYTDNFVEGAEWEFAETSSGIVTIDSRRFGDKVWVLLRDFLLPNMSQGSDLAESIDHRGSSTVRESWMTSWDVPVDDTHTLQIGFWTGPEGEVLKREVGFGQTPDRPYEEWQNTPGDYDVLVSQRPIAVHDLEHLVTTDRGVIMLRNMVKRSIQAVPTGRREQPHSPSTTWSTWSPPTGVSSCCGIWSNAAFRPCRRAKTPQVSPIRTERASPPIPVSEC